MALFTDPEGGYLFQYLPNQFDKNEKKNNFFVNQKRHLVGSLFTIYEHFGDFVKCAFTILLQFQQENTHLPVNTDKLKFVDFQVLVCTTALFIAQISTFLKISRKGTPSWLRSQKSEQPRKDIPSYGSQLKTRENCYSLIMIW